MKKIIIICVTVILVVGLSILVMNIDTTKVKTMKCSISGKTENGTEVKSDYTITYKGKYVKKVTSVESASINNKDTINAYKDKVEETYTIKKEIMDYAKKRYYQFSQYLKNKL